jgi:hypothetical protein
MASSASGPFRVAKRVLLKDYFNLLQKNGERDIYFYACTAIINLYFHIARTRENIVLISVE